MLRRSFNLLGIQSNHCLHSILKIWHTKSQNVNFSLVAQGHTWPFYSHLLESKCHELEKREKVEATIAEPFICFFNKRKEKNLYSNVNF